MKRIGNLYDSVCSLDNLRLADEKARRGKLKSYGVNKHDQNRETNIQLLHELLITGQFKTSPYFVFKIREPKERTIYRLPYFPDRILHHAIMNITESIWVKILTVDTFSCIKDRGIHFAAKRLKTDLKDVSGTRYCLKIDIKKYYPSIDHQILKEIIRRKIKDDRLLSLLDEIIDSAPGVPIGNYLSQYFANLYLAYFDHYVKEQLKVKYYYRYADDMVFLDASKERLHIIFDEVRIYLSSLKLTVKENWQISPVDSRGIDFLGYKFFHGYMLMRKSIKQNMFRCIKKNASDPARLMRSMASYYGWMKHCNSNNLLNKVTYEIQSRICRTSGH